MSIYSPNGIRIEGDISNFEKSISFMSFEHIKSILINWLAGASVQRLVIQCISQGFVAHMA